MAKQCEISHGQTTSDLIHSGPAQMQAFYRSILTVQYLVMQENSETSHTVSYHRLPSAYAKLKVEYGRVGSVDEVRGWFG